MTDEEDNEVPDGVERDCLDLIYDDGTSINIAGHLVKIAGPQEDQLIGPRDLDSMIKEDDFAKCYEAALHFLEYRPRSEAELKQHLLYKRKFLAAAVNRAIVKLRELQLIDDKAFAEAWMRDRIAFKPKSGLMIKRELLLKGVNHEIINEVTDKIDDETNAYKAGIKKARLLHNLAYAEFYQRLASYLGRRGYNGEVVQMAVSRLWDTIHYDSSEK